MKSISEKWFIFIPNIQSKVRKLVIDIKNNINDEDLHYSALKFITKCSFLFAYDNNKKEWSEVVHAFFHYLSNDKDKIISYATLILNQIKKREMKLPNKEEDVLKHFHQICELWYSLISLEIIPIATKHCSSNYLSDFFKTFDQNLVSLIQEFAINLIKNDNDFILFPKENSLTCIFSIALFNSFDNENQNTNQKEKHLILINYILKIFQLHTIEAANEQTQNEEPKYQLDSFAPPMIDSPSSSSAHSSFPKYSSSQSKSPVSSYSTSTSSSEYGSPQSTQSDEKKYTFSTFKGKKIYLSSLNYELDNEQYLRDLTNLFLSNNDESHLSEWIDVFLFAICTCLEIVDFDRLFKCLTLFRMIWSFLLQNNSTDRDNSVFVLITRIQIRFVSKYQQIGMILSMSLLLDMVEPSNQISQFIGTYLESTFRRGTNTHKFIAIIAHFAMQVASLFIPLFFFENEKDQNEQKSSTFSLDEPPEFQKDISKIFMDIEKNKFYNNQFLSDACQQLFSNPVLFSELHFGHFIPNSEEMSVNMCFFPHFLSDKWNTKNALSFVSILFENIPFEVKPVCFKCFIDVLLTFQRNIPLKYEIDRSFICSHFFNYFYNDSQDKNIDYEEFTMNDMNVVEMDMDILISSCKNTKIINNQEEKLFSWFLKLIHFMVLKNPDFVFLSLSACFETIQKYINESTILIPFVVKSFSFTVQKREFLQKYKESSNILNLMLSLLSMLLPIESINIPSKYGDEIETWPRTDESQEDASLLAHILSFSTDNGFVFKSQDLIQDLLASIFNVYKENPDYLYYIPFFIGILTNLSKNEDVTKSASVMLTYVCHYIDKTSDPKRINNFRSVDDVTTSLQDTKKQIIEYLTDFLLDYSKSISSALFAEILITLTDFILLDPSLIKTYFMQLENIIKTVDAEKFQIVVDTLNVLITEVSAGVKKVPNENLSKSTFIFYADKMVQALKEREDNVLMLMTRLPNGSYNMDIEPIFHENKPRTVDYFSYINSTDCKEVSCFEVIEKNEPPIHNKVLDSLDDSFKCKPSDFDDSFTDIEPLLEEKTSLTQKQRKKATIEYNKHDEVEALFSEKFYTSPHALFYTLVYDVLSDKLHIREDTPKIQRNCASLFTLDTDETAKIGVLYVGKNQRTQTEILRNKWTDTSVMFRDFLRSIGQFVDLAKHHGYDGKLDTTRLMNGDYSLYFKSQRIEMMYHVAPMFPTFDNDEQQVKKKRHIGNDNVHIVWNESGGDYDPYTIKSQFNDAHIIITPLTEHLFKVCIHLKDEKTLNGPLKDTTIVDGKVLGKLVRWSAFLLDKSIRNVPGTIEGVFRDTLKHSLDTISSNEETN